MNERAAAITGQVKQAFGKMKEAWENLSPLRKKIILFVLIGLVALAVVLTIVLRSIGNRYTLLYPNMPQDEAVRALSVLEEATIPARLNEDGQLEVPQSKSDDAMGQLAMQGIPQSTLGYEIFETAGGLTTTDFEKKQIQVNQLQNRMQDIIRTFDGVENAYVNIYTDQESNRVWDSQSASKSASVKVDLTPGAMLSAGQISGIRFLVAPAAGLEPEQVAVINSNGMVLAGAGEDAESAYASNSKFSQRMDFEEEVEQRMKEKTENILSMNYPDAEDYRISITATLDYDAMITERMQYTPMEGTDHGVVERDEYKAIMGAGQYGEGVVGETDNTDIPVYADLDGDGEMDAVDYYRQRDYLVDYVKEQIERDSPVLEQATIAVVVNDTLTNEARQTLRELIASSTNVEVDNITVEGVVIEENILPDTEIPWRYIYIGIGVLLLLIILLVIILVTRSKANKKKLALAEEEAAAEMEEQERIQQEIEERKRQLKDAAIGDQKESAITEEVREFAKNNPEITANLLRNWLKDGES